MKQGENKKSKRISKKKRVIQIYLVNTRQSVAALRESCPIGLQQSRDCKQRLWPRKSQNKATELPLQLICGFFLAGVSRGKKACHLPRHTWLTKCQYLQYQL